jgi:hypothetical protein
MKGKNPKKLLALKVPAEPWTTGVRAPSPGLSHFTFKSRYIMQTITFRDFEESPIQFVGALDFDRRGNGLGPRRLPAWTRPQVPQAMDVMVRMPSGVRLTFNTTSTRVELDVLTTRMVTPPAEPRSVAFDLQVDGGRPFTQVHNGGNTIILNPQKPDEFELVRGDPFTVVFDNLPATAKTCELWLPTNVFVELRSIALDDDASLSTPTTPRPPGPLSRPGSAGSTFSVLVLEATATWTNSLRVPSETSPPTS